MHWQSPANGVGQAPEAMADQGGTGTDSSKQAYAQARLGIEALRGTEALTETGMSRKAETHKDWRWQSQANGAEQEPEAKAVQNRASSISVIASEEVSLQRTRIPTV